MGTHTLLVHVGAHALQHTADRSGGDVVVIQRRLQIGYNRAATLIERMEQEGVVSGPNHKGVREVLLPDHSER